MSKNDLTEKERIVLDAVRHATRDGDPVAAGTVRDLVARDVGYDACNRALTKLVRARRISRPKRGFYLAENGR